MPEQINRYQVWWDIAISRVGCLPCTWLTWIQLLASSLVNRAPPGVIPEHRSRTTYVLRVTSYFVKELNKQSKLFI